MDWLAKTDVFLVTDNKQTDRTGPSRRQTSIVWASLIAFPILVWIAIQATTNTQDLNNWIDRTSDEYARYQLFLQRFGTDDDVIVSWNECQAGNPQIAEVVEQLRKSPNFARVVAGDEAHRRLRESASKFSDLSARRRLRGSMFGDDLKTCCIVIGVNEAGRSALAESVDLIEKTVSSVTGLDRDGFHLSGKAYNSLQLNRHTNRSLPLGIPGCVLAALVAVLAVGNVRLVFAALWAAGLAGLASLAIATLSGVAINGLLVLMPVLVFVLSLGGAIHMTRSLQTVRSHLLGMRWQEQLDRSLGLSRPPILISFSSTAIGFATLCFSPLSAVFQFGLFSAISLLLAMVLLLVLLPAVWAVLPVAQQDAARHPKAERIYRGLVAIGRYPAVVLLLAAAFLVPSIAGAFRFETDLQVSQLFAPKTQIAKDNQWVKENLFPTGRVELVVTFDRAQQLNRFRQLQYVRGIQSSIREVEGYHSALSVANFVRIPQTTGALERNLTQQFIAAQLEEDTAQLQKEGMLHSDQNFDRWRISIGCPVTKDRDEQSMAEEFLKAAIAALKENSKEVQIEGTGLGPISASGQRRLFSDLVRGLMTAIAVITPLLMLTLRRIDLGLLAMLPNLFPVLVVFGLCGWLGKRMDIGSILTASVGLGIAIDDTLHFLHYERLMRRIQEINSEKSSKDSVAAALHHCWVPVLTTTAIVCLGLSPFLFSQFLPIRNFAMVLSLLMLVAVVADLVLLPALLGGTNSNRVKKPNPGSSSA